MERKKNLLERYSLAFLYVIFFVGAVGHSVEFTRPLMIKLTPYTLLLTNAVVFYAAYKQSKGKIAIWFVITYTVTLLLEIIGVQTGLIFGAYEYGDVLGLQILDTPLIIGFNWVFVILGAVIIARNINGNYWFIPITALLAVLFDLVLEPVAITLGYWKWIEGGIPLQNFIAWFVVALIAAYLYRALKCHTVSNVPRHYFLIQLVFFFILNLTV